MALAVLSCGWFVLMFDTRWVPAGMGTIPEIPPGSWVIVDRWASGLRVGSDVFVATPHGVLLSRVSRLTADEVEITHPNRRSGWVDSAVFGPLPRANVQATVVAVFRPDEDDDGR
ncbi:MAG TPA: hypothetical protein ENI87_06395 [bacterium]|nr:hypothetical protein [bacterium]